MKDITRFMHIQNADSPMIDEAYWDDVRALKEIFEMHGWVDIKNELRENIFETTCKAISLLDNNQRALFVSLMRKFLRITDYEEAAWAIYEKITSIFSRDESIIIVPVSEESAKIKSAHSFCYEIKRFHSKEALRDVLFTDGSIPAPLPDKPTNIVLVDDFIGSGSQIGKFIEKNKYIFNSTSVTTYILAIVIQEKAKLKLSKIVDHIDALHFRPRALSDLYSVGGLSAKEAVDIYKTIEDKLSMHPMFRFGYNRTEALVSLKRTPNNTLPIFWHSRARGKKIWPAPFIRNP